MRVWFLSALDAHLTPGFFVPSSKIDQPVEIITGNPTVIRMVVHFNRYDILIAIQVGICGGDGTGYSHAQYYLIQSECLNMASLRSRHDLWPWRYRYVRSCTHCHTKSLCCVTVVIVTLPRPIILIYAYFLYTEVKEVRAHWEIYCSHW